MIKDYILFGEHGFLKAGIMVRFRKIGVYNLYGKL